MPIYYFDVLKGDVASSMGEGVEFSSDEFARAFALGLISTFQTGDQGITPQRVSIRNEAGMPVDEVSQDNRGET